MENEETVMENEETVKENEETVKEKGKKKDWLLDKIATLAMLAFPLALIGFFFNIEVLYYIGAGYYVVLFVGIVLGFIYNVISYAISARIRKKS